MLISFEVKDLTNQRMEKLNHFLRCKEKMLVIEKKRTAVIVQLAKAKKALETKDHLHTHQGDLPSALPVHEKMMKLRKARLLRQKKRRAQKKAGKKGSHHKMGGNKDDDEDDEEDNDLDDLDFDEYGNPTFDDTYHHRKYMIIKAPQIHRHLNKESKETFVIQ